MQFEIIKSDVTRALVEDIGSGDVTAALLPEESQIQAQIIAREPLVVCGKPWVDMVFADVNPDISVSWDAKEGDYIDKPGTLCRLTGPARSILTAERTALNFLQTLSATAYATYQFQQKLEGTVTRLLDTRKTIPGLRYAQKYAVRCGGGDNHRLGLYDAFLIKENHIRACGSIAKAVTTAKSMRPDLFIEVEVETLEELAIALSLPVNRIMLDNFNMQMLAKAIQMRANSEIKLEYSGNVSLDNITAIAKLGVDYISVGAITKSLRAIDLSLLIME